MPRHFRRALYRKSPVVHRLRPRKGQSPLPSKNIVPLPISPPRFVPVCPFSITLNRNTHSPTHSAAARSQIVSVAPRCTPANPPSPFPFSRETDTAPSPADSTPEPRTSAPPLAHTVRPQNAPLPIPPAFATIPDTPLRPS